MIKHLAYTPQQMNQVAENMTCSKLRSNFHTFGNIPYSPGSFPSNIRKFEITLWITFIASTLQQQQKKQTNKQKNKKQKPLWVVNLSLLFQHLRRFLNNILWYFFQQEKDLSSKLTTVEEEKEKLSNQCQHYQSVLAETVSWKMLLCLPLCQFSKDQLTMHKRGHDSEEEVTLNIFCNYYNKPFSYIQTVWVVFVQSLAWSRVC